MINEYGQVFHTASPPTAWPEYRLTLGARVVSLAAGGGAVAAVTEGAALHSEHVEADSAGAIKWLSGPESRPEDPAAVQETGTELRGVQMALGHEHSAILSRDGSLFTWGSGSQGQLGLGHLTSDGEPQYVESLEKSIITSVAVGRYHTAALTEDGALYTWGRSTEGQTGHGFTNAKARTMARDTDIKLAPRFVAVFLKTRVMRMSCGHSFSAAVTAEGKVFAWGEGGCGQLGIGRVTRADTPQLVLERSPGEDGAPFVDVACGWGHTLALTKRRRVYSWGFNAKGQLGVGDTTTRHYPTLITNPNPETTPAVSAEPSAVTAGDDTNERTEDGGDEGDKGALEAGDSKEDVVTDDADGDVNSGEDAVTELGETGEIGEGFGDTLQSTMTFGATNVSLGDTRALTLQRSVVDLLSVDEPPCFIKLEPDPSPADWDFPANDLIASQISAGSYHCAALSVEGHLYSWGSSEDDRLGLSADIVTQTLTDGIRDWSVFVPVVTPRRVTEPSISDRLISSVCCGDRTTVAFAPAVVDSISSQNGFDSGGSRLHISGRGLASLTHISSVRPICEVFSNPDAESADNYIPEDNPDAVEEELGAGNVPIPGVIVRFTQVVSASPRPGEPEVEPVVRFCRAYCVPPEYGDEEHRNTVSCLTPNFGIPADATVEILVGETAADRIVVRGSCKYTFFASPTLSHVEPQILPLSATVRPDTPDTESSSVPTVTISGEGLFGTMMADKQARLSAEALVAKVEDILTRREQAELKAIAALKSAPVGDESGAESDDDGADSKLEEGEDDEAEDDQEPPPPLGITLTTAEDDSSGHEAIVRFSLLVGGKLSSTSDPVPGYYIGKYEEHIPEPLPEVEPDSELDSEEESEDEDALAALEEPTKGVFTAVVCCQIPELSIPDALRETTESDTLPSLSIRVEVSPNGVDFIKCTDLIHSWAAAYTAVSPPLVPASGGSVLQITGTGFIESKDATVRLTLPSTQQDVAPTVYIVPAEFQTPSSLSCLLPPFTVAPSGSVTDSKTGDESEPVSAQPSIEEDDSLTLPGLSLLPPGKHTFNLEVALDGVFYEGRDANIQFSAYAGTLETITPMCTPIAGGSTVCIRPDGPTADAEWFVSTPDTHVRVHNDSFDERVPCEWDSSAKVVRFVVPTFRKAAEGDGEEAAGDSKEEDGAVSGEADGSGGEGSGDASGETEGEEGEGGEDAGAPGPDLEVTVSLSLDGSNYIETSQPLVLSYYDLSALHVTSVTPAAKVALGSEVSVAVEGWDAKDIEMLKVRFSRGTELTHCVSAALSEDGMGCVVTLPTVEEGWSPGDIAVEVSIDGTNFTSDEVTISAKK